MQGIKTMSMAKELHSRISKNRELVRAGDWFSTDDLRVLRGISTDIIEMIDDIRELQRERTE
ncbi:hypothetical protein OAF54_01040 [bacterium]|nr:hypothetical protein [bacterium]